MKGNLRLLTKNNIGFEDLLTKVKYEGYGMN